MDSTQALAGSLYRIEQELGSGGGGVVYKAWNTHLQKHVVIKELKRGTRDNIMVQRNEVEALKNVKSAYLPQVLDFFVENGRVFTVMEYISGISFDKLLSRNYHCDQSQVVRWYAQLASALEVIHSQNIAHRDIKPANIMLLPNDDICLIDFNAALVGGNDAMLISRSLGYASPEQYDIFERYKHSANSPVRFTTTNTNNRSSGVNYPNIPMTNDVMQSIDWMLSDIYSLGATMYHLLTGIRPPQRASEVIPLSEVGKYDEGLIYIIERSMKFDPSERISSAHELVNAIRNIHKFDSRWKRLKAKQITASVLLPVSLCACFFTSYVGYSKMNQDKENEYYSAVYSIQTCEDPLQVFDEAQEMFDRIDPYYALAQRYWSDGNLTECREFILSNLSKINSFNDEASSVSLGGIYYMLGDCYYYQSGNSDYQNALINYESALEFVPTNPIYYRDYAITLAKLGNTEKAKQELEKAKKLMLDKISVFLLNGEIEYAEKDYMSALDNFSCVISQSSDEYIRYRAYHSSDEILKLEDRYTESIDLLEDSLKKIPINRIPEMKERLAQSYYLSGNNTKAIEIFEELIKTTPSFIMQQNLAILYQRENDFERAAEILSSMKEQFPEDYRVPMRQAFLEIDIQSKVPVENREYSAVSAYYEEALRLYQTNNRDGSDPEMMQLENLVDQLKSNGWIE